MNKYAARRLVLAGVMSLSAVAGVLVAESTEAHGAESPSLSACKDAASEGDESRIAARYAKCDRQEAKRKARKLPACENEDGPGPCVWDARTSGNGRGHSFWITCDQTVHYFNDKDERRWGNERTDAYPSKCKDKTPRMSYPKWTANLRTDGWVPVGHKVFGHAACWTKAPDRNTAVVVCFDGFVTTS